MVEEVDIQLQNQHPHQHPHQHPRQRQLQQHPNVMILVLRCWRTLASGMCATITKRSVEVVKSVQLDQWVVKWAMEMAIWVVFLFVKSASRPWISNYCNSSDVDGAAAVVRL